MMANANSVVRCNDRLRYVQRQIAVCALQRQFGIVEDFWTRVRLYIRTHDSAGNSYGSIIANVHWCEAWISLLASIGSTQIDASTIC